MGQGMEMGSEHHAARKAAAKRQSSFGVTHWQRPLRAGGVEVRQAVKAVVEHLEVRRLLSGATGGSTDPDQPGIKDPPVIQPPQPADDDTRGIVNIDWHGRPAEAIDGEFVLRLNNVSGTKIDQVRQVQATVSKLRKDMTVLKQLDSDGLVLLRGPKGLTYDVLKKSLRLAPGFNSLEPNFHVEINSTIPND